MTLGRIKIAFFALLGLLIGSWLISVGAGEVPATFWQARRLLVPFTGILAISMMAAGVLLAARPVQIERFLGGLDKFYRLHKWLGIGAVIVAIAHWLLEVAPRWAIGWGWLERPARSGPPRGAGGGESLMQSLRHPAAEVGEWGFYLLLALTALALWKRFPYHLFFKTHRLMAPLFLALLFHAVVMMPTAFWSAPIGIVSGVLMAGGGVAALASLFHRIGHSRRAVGRICSLHAYRANSVLDVGVALQTSWPGHEAGQFAFLDFDHAEGAHPFTVSSSWRGDGKLMFSIKGLGDYTRRLPQLLKLGQAVTVEGPYGRFDFHGDAPRQLWVAGGVGITPFVARLQKLVEAPTGKPVDLIYSTAARDDEFVGHVRELAERAGVAFHLLDTQKEGFLTLERLQAWAPGWREADVWFCGPLGFGKSLYGSMAAAGLPDGRFHQELFEMR